MDLIQHVTLFGLFFFLGLFLNKRHIRGLPRHIGGGIYVPSFVVALLISLIFAVATWFIAELLLWGLLPSLSKIKI